jgi:tetratricopeptide (TPR) repeat protein
MSKQAKTRRRLFFLLSVTLALVILIGGGALFRLYWIQRRALQARAQGLTAMARSDYPTALDQLGRYLSRHPDDAEILLPYAKARRLVEEPDNRHLGEAMACFRRVLELRPGLAEAQRSLLEIYLQIGYNTEAIALADTILTKSPADTEALHIKVLALMRMQRLEQAETNAQRLTAANPLDLEFHLLQLQLMLDRGHQDRVQAYADHLAQAHRDDVRFNLLRSIAASLTGNTQSAIRMARPLVTRAQPDAAYTRLLVRQLDNLGLFGDAFLVLQQAAKTNSDPTIAPLWLSRLFETNRLALLVEETQAMDPSAAGSDLHVLAMRVLALARLNRRPEAMNILAAMDQRGHGEPAAARWAAALRAVTATDAPDPIQTIRALHDAMAGNAPNPILLEEIGDAYAAAGAVDKAAATWRSVAGLAPAWSAPLVRLSQTLIAGGSAAEGLAAAKAAQLRAPDDRDVLMSLAAAAAANLPAGPSSEAGKVLEQLADIHKQFPNDLDVLPLEAGVLAQTREREQAIGVIRSALAARPGAPEHVLLSLAGLSESFKLDQEDACFDACQKAYGLTANLAFARARSLFNRGRPAEGLRLLEQARAGHGTDDVTWHAIWAAYLDMIDDPRAKAEWIALGDANVKNVRVQRAALSSRAVQGDHDFLGRTIDRLSDLLGKDSVSLSLVRARWLLQGQSTEKDVTTASILLSGINRSAPDMVAPRLLLATCYMRMGNISGAIDQLAAVCDMQPQQAGIALELARLLQVHGDFARARQYIDRATRSRSATIPNLRQAASLLALQGEYAAALALLEKAYSGADKQPPDLVLGALYRQLNQPAKADQMCRRLLEKPDAAAIAFCADFYASEGRSEEAQHALKLLDGLKLPPGAKELVLADFSARYGTSDEALKQFRAGVQAAPNQPAIWKQLVAYCLATGQIDQALAAADQAVQKSADSGAFTTLRQNADLVKQAAHLAGTHQLLMMLTGSSTADSAPVLDALRTIVAAGQQKESPRSTAAKLRQLADRNPRILPLQTITLQWYMEAGQVEEAVTMATQTIQSFPTAVEPLRLATGALGAAQQWDQALGTAKEWRRMDSAEALDADLAIATAELHLGDAGAASRQIQPYLDRALLDPEKFSGIVLLHAQALLASHRPAKVEALLTPLLPQSAQWRKLWLSLAVRAVDDPARAQKWLEQVGPLVEANLNEKTALAQAWLTLGNRWSNPQFTSKGRELLQAIVQMPNAPVIAMLNWGTLCDAASDWPAAERISRRVLQQDPASAIALNNLAYALVKGHGDLSEAQQLAAKALSLAPNSPAFLDTKAAVQAAMKDYSGAVDTLRAAQRLDPRNMEWRINLLAILIDSGQTPAARAEMREMTPLFAAASDISPALRQRYDSLRARLP